MSPLALVVENDGGTRKLLDVLLTRFGWEVDAVANGSDALLLLERIDYEVTVVDLVTPGASGTDIVEWLRAHRPEAVERTVMLSAAPPPIGNRIRAAYPALRVMQKPFELAEVIEFIEGARQQARRAPIGVADQFSRRSITAGAKSGVLVRRSGSQIELVHEFGYRGRQIESLFPMSSDDGYPLCTCVRDGRALWIASPADAALQYPHLAATWRQHESRAVASVPVIRDGQVIGAAAWSFREPRPFDESEQRAFTAIAAETAVLLEDSQSAAPAEA